MGSILPFSVGEHRNMQTKSAQRDKSLYAGIGKRALNEGSGSS